MNTTKTAWWISSTGEGLSLTIKGALIALLPAILMIARLFGIEIMKADLVLLVDLLSKFVAGAVIAVGLIRKIYYAIERRINR